MLKLLCFVLINVQNIFFLLNLSLYMKCWKCCLGFLPSVRSGLYERAPEQCGVQVRADSSGKLAFAT